jgi:Uncharacterized protein involved in chromosome partitioning
MKKKSILFAAAMVVGLMLASASVLAQKDSSSVKISFGADVVSSYIWRGSPSMTPNGATASLLSPNLQPNLTASYKNFSAGSWASYDFLGSYYETDLFASYTLQKLTFTVNDYFWSYNARYFDYKNASTAHIIEAMVTFNGGDDCPFYLTAATFLYGADKKATYDPAEADLRKQNYSSYVEAGYSFKVGASSVASFIGVTPADGYYGDGAGIPGRANVKGFQVVNLGVATTKNLQLSDRFSVPFKASLVANPVLEKVFLVVGITL